MIFYLGTHQPAWLGRVDVPLFVSHRTLKDRKTFPRARAPWALDSGGFSELSLYGGWQTSIDDYIAAVRRYRDEIGNLAWAAPQDWMCEEAVLAKTGLSVAGHQSRTIHNYLLLRDRAPELPFIPVLQGWTQDDYRRCVDMYLKAGVELWHGLVGVGSVCRRQNTSLIAAILWMLADQGLSLHGFGVKRAGIMRYAGALTSADSLAWSFGARRSPPMPGHPHKNCANCAPWAMRWREKVLDAIAQPRQHPLFA